MIGKEIIKQNIHSPLRLLVIRRHLACKKGKEKQITNSATLEISVFSFRSCPQNKQTNKQKYMKSKQYQKAEQQQRNNN